MLTPLAPPQLQHLSPTPSAIADAIRGRPVSAFEQRLLAVLCGDSFQQVAGETTDQACRRSYARLRFLRDQLDLRVDDLFDNVEDLFALHEWTGIFDGTLCTLISIHYNLAIGSILKLGNGRAELRPLLEELETIRSVGVFLATEVAYGSNVLSLQTEARYDRSTREFVLHTPGPGAQKFMPNTGVDGVAKLGIVLARLVTGDQDCGVFPFIVRIRTEDSLCPGVHVTPLGEKPGYPLDNAVTSFDRVRIPKSHWLSGPESVLTDEGAFSSTERSRRQRFLQALDRVQVGKICLTSSTLAGLKTSVDLAIRYSRQRLTFAPQHPDVPVMAYRSQQRALFSVLAWTYALESMVRLAQDLYRAQSDGTDVATNRHMALTKAFTSARVQEMFLVCRERIGAQGLFSANRISLFLLHIQGIITAEGDNHIIQLKAARELMTSDGYTPPQVQRAPILSTVDFDLDEFVVSALEYREAMQHQRLLERMQQRLQVHGELFPAWNDCIHDAAAMVQAHSERLALEAFAGRIAASPPGIADVLLPLWRLCALELLSGDAAFFLAEGMLSAQQVRELSHALDELCVEILPISGMLTEAFGLPHGALGSPLADDYVRAYDFLPEGHGKGEH